MVRALGVLHSLQSKKLLAVEKRQEMNILSNEEKEWWFEDYVDRDTAVASEPVKDAETATWQKQEQMNNADGVGLSTRNPEISFEGMLNGIVDRLSDLASSDDEEDREDEQDDEEDTEVGKLSEDDEPGRVMGTISKTTQLRMVSFG